MNDTNNVRAIESLSQKANVPVDEIQKLLQLLETKVKINVDEAYLFDVNRRIKLFIASSGIQRGTLSEGIKKFEGVVRRELLISSVALISGLFVFLLLTDRTKRPHMNINPPNICQNVIDLSSG